MNAEDARGYMQRWKLVAEVEQREAAQASPTQKLRDLAMLVEAARALGGPDEEDEEAEQVRLRWNLLGERMGA